MVRALFALPFLLLAGCSWPAGDAPSSASAPIALTVDGLAQLFRKECLEQRSAAWARLKYRNIADGCWPDDCSGKIDSSLSWTVPTTDGSTVEVTLDWDPPLDFQSAPPDHSPLNCSIAVKPKDAPLLRRVLAGIRTKGRQPIPAPESGTAYDADASWEWQSADPAVQGPRVMLIRYFLSEDAYRAAATRAGTDPATLAPYFLSEVRRHTAHPWKLRFVPIDIQRLPTQPCPSTANCVEPIDNNAGG